MAVSLRLDPKTERDLNYYIQRHGRSKTDVIRQAIVIFLSDVSTAPNNPYQIYLQLESSLEGSARGTLSLNYKRLISKKLNLKRARG